MRLRLCMIVALAAAMLAPAALVPAARADTVAVPCSASALVDDLLSAYAAPGSVQTLSLAPRCTYQIPAPPTSGTTTPFWWYGPAGLPAIDGAITIDGNGATLARAGGEAPFRFFYVAADPLAAPTAGYTSPGAGALRLQDLTLSGGLARGGSASASGGGAGMGGAIFNQGSLTLDAVTIDGSTAQGGTGAQSGCCQTGGGGIGTSPAGELSGGGGFGPGDFGGAAGGAGSLGGGGGGGGGFQATETGGAGTAAAGGDAGGGATGLAGAGGAGGGAGGDGGGGGGLGRATGLSGAGGAFGAGGDASGGGGGGVGGGGAAGVSGAGGGGGFGGGGGLGGGDGGFGGGGGPELGDIGAGTPGFGGGLPGAHDGLADGGGGAGMGGAIFNMQGSVAITSSTLAGNAAIGGTVPTGSTATGGEGLGGALFNLDGQVALAGATLAGNQAAQGGAGIYDLGYDALTARTADASVADSIVYDSGAGAADVISDRPRGTAAGADVAAARVQLAAANLVLSSAPLGAATIVGLPPSGDPELGPLRDNGGPGMATQAPAGGSPALGVGALCPVSDELGGFRPSGRCDLGAVELTPTGPPGAAIAVPGAGATYTAGAPVAAAYTCSDPAGPGIAGCSAPVADGRPIDTSTPGSFTFRVTATSRDGRTSATAVTYTVVPRNGDRSGAGAGSGSGGGPGAPSAPPRSRPSRIGIASGAALVVRGRTAVTLRCRGGRAPGPCAGTLTVTARSGRRTVLLARARYRVPRGRARRVSLRLTRAGLALLGRRHRLRARARAAGARPATRTLVVRERRR